MTKTPNDIPAVAAALTLRPMIDAPEGKLFIAVSAWGQFAVVIREGGTLRYGPKPGQTWDAAYPVGWLPIHASEWGPEPFREAFDVAVIAAYNRRGVE
ncbi:hypothetical protein JDN40_14380 [Rhodomicrobium vannielii ATCC 17100]|uniref:hypothetical protein n=1 Tax=Rhodomicrobium vannielii TaxID=1069 RepID=UPI0019196B74|nr:hypothetical protein [Rhodomicrobium vannielii]MBJ7535295.1 hypothetical protein [Rhodomicrobium vannielii ATCC 17100]